MKMKRAEKPRRRGLWRRRGLARLGLLLGAGVFHLNALSLGGDPLPMPVGIGAAVVLSGSMEPTLHVNDLVFVREAASCEPGDIVIWQSGRTLTIHRVQRVGEDSFVTRGDANNTDDEPVPLSALRGRLIFRVPLLGMLVRALRTPVGVLTLLIAALLLTELPLRRERALDAQQLDELKEEITRLRQVQTEEEKSKQAGREEEEHGPETNGPEA